MAGGRKGKQVAREGSRPSKKRREPLVMQAPSGKGKGDTISQLPDSHDPERWALFGNRRIWPERGINLTVFANTFVPETVDIMRWTGFARTPNMAALELVREFYYAMVPYQFYQGVPVMVRGTEVRITASRINRWFGAPEDLGDLVDGLPEHEHFEPYGGELASNLRMDGDTAWNDYRHPLLLSELKLDAAFWLMFETYSLVPSTHRTNLGYDLARCLYCTRNGLRMDIGQIIMKGICRGGHSTKGPLPFPCLITHFCERSGLIGLRPIMGPMLDEDIVLFDGEFPDDDPDDHDYNEQNLDEDPDAEHADQMSGMSEFLSALQEMRLQIDTNHQAYMGEFAYMTARMDSFQRGLTDAGIHIPYVQRRATGPSTSEPGSSSQQAPQDPTMPRQHP
ncbi:hypothetical protein Dsin_001662 [Dipteronia sinensis]|uniref:Putative plant transposon protein domain-containing protein n=1 Tax=Dipteronia sinensis TaxID=43782 RepID=A0AAE0B4C3_9ROSI|nr:hypothetical protein Dsin_001662 [Dipteronia sinensis]